MQHKEKVWKSLSHLSEEILGQHNFLCAREQLSTEDHLRAYLMCLWLDVRDWFVTWPLLLFWSLFMAFIYLSAANSSMVGNWEAIVIWLLLGAVAFYLAIKLIDCRRIQRREKYFQSVKRIRVFLVTRAKDSLCMRKLIRLYSSLVDHQDILYSKDPVSVRPEAANLPNIEDHKLFSFVFVDLGRKPRGSYQYFRSRCLFLGAAKPHPANSTIASLFSNEVFNKGCRDEDANLETVIPQSQNADVATVRGLLSMPKQDLDQLIALYFDKVTACTDLGPRRIRQRKVMAATGWVLKMAQEQGVDLRILRGDTAPAGVLDTLEELRAQAKMKWSLDDMAVEEITPSKVHTFVTGQSRIVSELKVISELLSS